VNQPKKTPEELGREGWRLSATTGGDDLRRVLEMCSETGFEVYLETVLPQDCGDCAACFNDGNTVITRVYTRRRPA